MAAQSVALRFALACVSLASRVTAQGIPGTDCCPGTDPANTCYGWFQADASNVCPTDRMARSSCDCHQPRDAAGNIALSMEECCMNTCYLSGFTDATCPEGTSARGEHDFHQPMNGEFTAEECCRRSCFSSGFTDATCPDGTSARGEHDFHQPMNGEFTAEECCRRSCFSSGFTDATCPDGTRARGEHDFHQPMNGEFTAEECCTRTVSVTPAGGVIDCTGVATTLPCHVMVLIDEVRDATSLQDISPEVFCPCKLVRGNAPNANRETIASCNEGGR